MNQQDILLKKIKHSICIHPITQVAFLAYTAQKEIETTHQISPQTIELLALKHNIIPERYLRNHTTLSCANQLALLRASVLIIGLGGLGGHILEALLRLGVGNISGADGDSFEPSNLNRQLLCTAQELGINKAHVAAQKARNINPAVVFTAISTHLTPEIMPNLFVKHDIIIDALGGLALKNTVKTIAAQANKPLVTAAIAGWTGIVSTSFPHDKAPAEFLGQQQNKPIEDQLGTLAPTVAFATSIMCSEIVKIITTQEYTSGYTVFDLADQTFLRVKENTNN